MIADNACSKACINKEIKENYFLQLDAGDAMKTYDTRLKSE